MSTEAQINANRLNAKKSTGPKTAQGKATVAKNAVKHGFFALDTVISGESQQDYEAFREALLEELAPDGAMQTMLSERIVSLSWRLKRIENIQNQVIEAMLERDFDNPLSRQIQKLVPEHLRQKKSEHLALGYVTLKDYANSRAMDRLLMYERRLENSLFRTTNELRKLKIIKEFEDAQTACPEQGRGKDSRTKESGELVARVSGNFSKNSAPHCFASQSKAWGRVPSCALGKNSEQSQFASTETGLSTLIKEEYDDIADCGPSENKANSSVLPCSALP